jgi:small subunit ribosomal protein S4
MARYTGPVCRLCRREGQKLFLKGLKCFTEKCPVERRPYAPGQHGQSGGGRRKKASEYAHQLREKQKVKRIYGVAEKPFRNLFEKASHQTGVTGENLLVALESRLDNVVYRAGLARTRRMARQLVSHGHFTVNGVKVDIPSYRVSQYDIIDVKDKSLNTLPFEVARETAGDRPIPGWLQVVGERQRILVHQLPERAQIDVPLTEQLIVEFYSK